MVKKIVKSEQSTSSKAEAAQSPLASSVKESAQQIWLAGMGAFSKAQEEGTKVFEALVKEGMSLQKKTQGIAEDKLGEVSGKMSAMADTVTAKAGQNWDKLEAIFEQRTAKALGKLGVPTAKDVAALSERLATLEVLVTKLSKGQGATAVKAAPAKAVKAAKGVKAAAPAPAAAPAKKAAAKRARKTAA